MYDPNAHQVACPAALEAVSMANFSGTFTVYVKPLAAGDITIEQSGADAVDACISDEVWVPVTTTDACADPVVTADAIITITEDDVAGGGVCAVKINCVDSFIRFSEAVFIVGEAKRGNLQPVQTGCAPLVI